MSETIGSLIDKLSVVNLKMWNAQDVLYEIRRLSLEQFKEKYQSDEGMKQLYDVFQKSCNLNFQRNVLIDDIDKKIVEMIKSNHLEEYIQPKWKTY